MTVTVSHDPQRARSSILPSPAGLSSGGRVPTTGAGAGAGAGAGVEAGARAGPETQPEPGPDLELEPEPEPELGLASGPDSYRTPSRYPPRHGQWIGAGAEDGNGAGAGAVPGATARDGLSHPLARSLPLTGACRFLMLLPPQR